MGAEKGARGAHISASEVTLNWSVHTLFSFWFLWDGEAIYCRESGVWMRFFAFITF